MLLLYFLFRGAKTHNNTASCFIFFCLGAKTHTSSSHKNSFVGGVEQRVGGASSSLSFVFLDDAVLPLDENGEVVASAFVGLEEKVKEVASAAVGPLVCVGAGH